MAKQLQVVAERGKVFVVYPFVDIDTASGYPYDTTRTMEITALEAEQLSALLHPAAIVARQQSQDIRDDKRQKLEKELAKLGD